MATWRAHWRASMRMAMTCMTVMMSSRCIIQRVIMLIQMLSRKLGQKKRVNIIFTSANKSPVELLLSYCLFLFLAYCTVIWFVGQAMEDRRASDASAGSDGAVSAQAHRQELQQLRSQHSCALAAKVNAHTVLLAAIASCKYGATSTIVQAVLRYLFLAFKTRAQVRVACK
jgi:hypothetical protein